MNDTEMSQQERDAELIAKYRERMYTDKDGVMMFEFDPPDVHEPVEVDESDAAMLRTIDALTAERDRLRADVDVVATALEAAYAYSTGKPERWGPGYEQVRNILRNAFTELRAALAAPAGDGADGDGERGAGNYQGKIAHDHGYRYGPQDDYPADDDDEVQP